MEPGLYVLVPLGMRNGPENMEKPIPLFDSVMFSSFQDDWKQEIKRFVKRLHPEPVVDLTDEVGQLDSARYCLLYRFSEPGGGKLIHSAVYDLGEMRAGELLPLQFPLHARWRWSLGVLVLAGPIHFGCFEQWFGLQIPGPSNEPCCCYEGLSMEWRGRVRFGEYAAAADRVYWSQVRSVVDRLARCAENSRPGIAMDMFTRATFAKDWRLQVLMFWIALEALFTPGPEGELSHQLCERAAAFLRSAGDERVSLYRNLRSAYKIRSRLVHGSLGDPRGVQRTKITAAISLLEDTAREALCRVLTDTEMTDLFMNNRALKAHFEALVLGSDSPRAGGL